jgi:hypothetical protein
MKISTLLDHIDSGFVALTEFQRGYVSNRDQVRGVMDSLYRRHPVGSLLVRVTGAEQINGGATGATSHAAFGNFRYSRILQTGGHYSMYGRGTR